MKAIVASIELSRRLWFVLVMVVILPACSPSIVRAEEQVHRDPVQRFIASFDSVRSSGGDIEPLVRAKRLLVGSALRELLESGFSCLVDQKPDSALAIYGKAKVMAAASVALGGPSVHEEEVKRYVDWTQEEIEKRKRATELRKMADAAVSFGMLEKALGYENEALELFLSIGDRFSVALCLGSLGVINWYRNDLDAVLSSYKRALRLRTQLEDGILVGKTLNGLGSTFFRKAEYDSAVHFYLRAIETRKRTGDLSGLFTSYTYLAVTYDGMGLIKKAAELLDLAAPLEPYATERHQRYDLYNTRAMTYRHLGRIDEANEAFEAALKEARALGDAGREASTRINMVDNLLKEARFDEALENLDALEELLARWPDLYKKSEFFKLRALAHLKLGDVDSAKRDMISYVKTCESLEDRSYYVDALLNLGYLYRNVGGYKEALSCVSKAREAATGLGKAGRAREMASLESELLGMLRRFDEALAILDSLLVEDRDAGDRLAEAKDLIRLANVHARKDEEPEARKWFVRAGRMVAHLGLPELSCGFYLGMGHTFERENPDSAFHYYEKALATVEKMRSGLSREGWRVSFFSGERRYYFEEIARFYARMAKRSKEKRWLGRVFLAVERAKARTLLDLIEGVSIDATASLEEEVVVRSGRVGRLEQLSSAIGNGKVLLEYALGDTASLLLAVTSAGSDVFILPSRRDIAFHVERLRDALGHPGRGDALLVKTARKLFEEIMEPAGKWLEGADTLIIVPDGILFQLPFDLLLTREPKKDAPWKELPFLTRASVTVYSPSASIFMAKRDGHYPSFDLDLIAYGDPDFSELGEGKVPLASLPGTREEIESIGSMFPDARSIVRTGREASESDLKKDLLSGTPRILHLATHGVADPFRPELSRILLSMGEGEDGRLTAGELLGMDLKVALVVLSACQTAGGRVSRGEGVIGLGRAILAAGAGGVVASLWRIPDLSTREFMEEFYYQMAQACLPSCAALRLARLSLLRSKEFSHPFYWAPFVLVGTDRTPWEGAGN